MYELEAFIIFILAIALAIYRDRKNIKLEGIVIMRRTERGRKFIDNLAKGHPRFWNAFMTLAVVVSIPVMAFAFYFLLVNAVQIAMGSSQAGAMIILPGPVSEAEVHTVVLVMPWYFWVLGIFSVLIPHEFSHGIASRLEKIRIKSLGWLLLLFLPGAFVEPDENQLKKAKRSTKLRVYGAGSFANIVVAMIALIAGLAFVALFFHPAGILYGGIVKDSPMDIYNVSGSIMQINGINITSSEELQSTLRNIPANSSIDVKTTSGIYSIVTAARPDGSPGSYLGIGPFPGVDLGFGISLGGGYGIYQAPDYQSAAAVSVLEFLRMLLDWVFVLNLGIGIINLLPLKPFDGGLIFEAISEKFLSKKSAARLVIIVSLASAFLLLFNIIGNLIF